MSQLFGPSRSGWSHERRAGHRRDDTDHPAFFALLSTALRAAGRRVLTFTFRDPAPEAHARVELAGWGVGFDELVLAPSREGSRLGPNSGRGRETDLCK